MKNLIITRLEDLWKWRRSILDSYAAAIGLPLTHFSQIGYTYVYGQVDAA